MLTRKPALFEKNRRYPVNRRLLVLFLIVLAVGNIGTLLAMGILTPELGSSNTINTTTTFDSSIGMTSQLTTTLIPRIHQHYKVDLSVSMGNCAGPNGRAC